MKLENLCKEQEMKTHKQINQERTRISRRGFLASAAATAAALTTGAAGADSISAVRNSSKFRLKYAPHFGMFEHHAGKDHIDQIKFMADTGFSAMEDNGMMGRPIELQKKIASQMEKLDMTMGVFVVGFSFGQKNFVSSDKSMREKLVNRMKEAVEVAKRVNAKWCTVVPGAYDEGLQPEYQTANVIENLKWCAQVCEPSGLVMVLEPLNPWKDHAGLFLKRIPQAYQICRAVDSPSCKILDDLYHQQVTEGNLIPNLDRAWDQIAYIQVGDNPGRKEPTTGEINYKNIFKHLHNKGYQGVIGMEHGNKKGGEAGEKAVIEAYRSCDSF